LAAFLVAISASWKNEHEVVSSALQSGRGF